MSDAVEKTSPAVDSKELRKLEKRNRRLERRKHELVDAKKRGGARGPRPGCCEFFIKGKNRYCGVAKAENSTFCAHHGGAQEKGKRVPCPLDPTHDVYTDQLRKHLQKCASIQQTAVWTSKPYYAPGLQDRPDTDGLSGVQGELAPKHTTRTMADFSDVERITMIGRLDDLECKILSHVKSESRARDLIQSSDALVLPIEERHSKECENGVPQEGHIEGESLDSGEVKEPLRAQDTTAKAQEPHSNKIKGAAKHHNQESVIMRCVRALVSGPSCTLPNNLCLLDMGAGKGALSLHAKDHFEDVKELSHILVDRRAFSYKKDPLIAASAHRFERIKMDLRDIDLWKVPTLEALPTDGRAVLIAKHLCGVATCFALRGAASPQICNGKAVDAIVVALCCHGACTWDGFLDRDILKLLGLSRADFELIKSMAGWAIDHDVQCCDNEYCEGTGEENNSPGGKRRGGSKEVKFESEQGEETATKKARLQRDAPCSETEAEQMYDSLTRPERQRIGLQCKNILNLARVHYLQAQGYDACLQTYTDANMTKENTLLIALRQRDTSKSVLPDETWSS